MNLKFLVVIALIVLQKETIITKEEIINVLGNQCEYSRGDNCKRELMEDFDKEYPGHQK